MKTAHIKIQLDPGATMPVRAHIGDVGYDVTCLSFGFLHDNGARTFCESENQIKQTLRSDFSINHAIIDTGVHVQPETGYYVELVPNSRQGKTGIRWNASIGIIDPCYTGSIKLVITWGRDNVDELKEYLPGKVVGQLIVRELVNADWQQVDKLEPTERGDGGFGSTANK